VNLAKDSLTGHEQLANIFVHGYEKQFPMLNEDILKLIGDKNIKDLIDHYNYHLFTVPVIQCTVIPDIGIMHTIKMLYSRSIARPYSSSPPASSPPPINSFTTTDLSEYGRMLRKDKTTPDVYVYEYILSDLILTPCIRDFYTDSLFNTLLVTDRITECERQQLINRLFAKLTKRTHPGTSADIFMGNDDKALKLIKKSATSSYTLVRSLSAFYHYRKSLIDKSELSTIRHKLFNIFAWLVFVCLIICYIIYTAYATIKVAYKNIRDYFQHGQQIIFLLFFCAHHITYWQFSNFGFVYSGWTAFKYILHSLLFVIVTYMLSSILKQSLFLIPKLGRLLYIKDNQNIGMLSFYFILASLGICMIVFRYI
jgi:hypothetical protein